MNDQIDSTGSRKKNSWTARVRIIGTLLSIGLLIWLLSQQNWEIFFNIAGDLNVVSLLLALLLVLGRMFANSVRWFRLLKAQKTDVTLLQTTQFVFAGRFASNFLPTTIGGDVIRAAAVIPYSENKVAGAASVVLDRLVGVFGMLFFLPFCIVLIPAVPSIPLLSMIPMAAFTEKLLDMVRKTFLRLREAVLIWRNKPSSLVQAVLASWVGTLLYITGVWILAVDMNIDVSWVEVTAASVVTYFVVLIPLSINGLGLRELTVIGLYTALGASPEQAAALAILTRALQMITTIPGAFWLGKMVPDRSENDEGGG